jgi:hypothetical protein
MQKVILTLLQCGDSDHTIQKITGIRPEQWEHLATENPDFRKLLGESEEARDGGLSILLRDAMRMQIKKGHPWWAKLAIHNYNVGLIDPDVNTAVKLKRMLERSFGFNSAEFLAANPAVANAKPPPGAIPAVE